MDSLSVLTAAAAFTAAAFLVLWIISLIKQDASIVDIYWGPGFLVIALVGLFAGPALSARDVLVITLVGVWGLRLGTHLLRRNRGQPEDRRYAAMRRHFNQRFWIVSLFTVFLLQAALMWLVSLPLQWAMLASYPPDLTTIDAAGAIVCVAGFFFEAVGDWQLARFKADPANAGAVMDRGLWRYTRHPNYFGDALFWWGIFLIALGTSGGWWTVIGPIVMTVLLLRVSGVALLERTIARRRPAYANYVQRTSAFVPWPPR